MPADSGRVAVVSGAGSGLGREIALALGRRGHPLALLGRRRAALEETLSASGGQGVTLACDVRDAAAVGEAALEISSRFGAAEVVVPAAGVAAVAPLAETSPEIFHDVLATNLIGAFHLMRAFLPAMIERRRGFLVPILSAAARRGFPGWSAYCASKWGLAGLVAALREELRSTGVRVTALYPGATATPLWDGLPGEWDRRAMIPAGEVARAVVFALEADDRAALGELHIAPAGGDL
ncbi:MAG TPA: SDR family oxidoreductase [Thermoanaerobaculia bacterium]|nr:SDR family oxidoreductase [Thermoanaerobaculia bacterium]